MYRRTISAPWGRAGLCAGAITSLLFASTTAIFAAPLKNSPDETSGSTETSALSGVYTVDQATRGKLIYSENCGLCHGNSLRGSDAAPALAGAMFRDNWIGANVADLYGYIVAEMPPGRGGSLEDSAYTDITAYILATNKYPAGSVKLPADPEQLNILIEAIPK